MKSGTPDIKANHNFICAILVTYYPQKKLLKTVIKALKSQVQGIVVVDNSTSSHNQLYTGINNDVTHRIFLSMNKGVAYAQNAGIEWARKNGYSHVILMDQDSIPHPFMVFRLYHEMLSLEKLGKTVAAVGPKCYYDAYNRYEPFVRGNRNRIHRVWCNGGSNSFQVEYLISSGSLININVFDSVGGMDESLFIDLIDVEWGYRAQSKGYYCYAVCTATIDHQLGVVVQKKMFKKQKFIKHQPERYFYQFRNTMLLFKKSYVPLVWKIYQLFRQIVPRFLLQALIIAPRRRNIIMMMMGLYYGMIGISGPIKNSQ